MRSAWRRIACCAAFAAISVAAQGAAHEGVSPSAGGLTEEQEIETGRELAGRLLGATPLVGDAALQMYVNAVGRRIAAQSERPELPWRFGIVRSEALNAYSAPGGYVFITAALYRTLVDEAQLAAALAHPIAAIAARHHIEVARKSAVMAAMARLGRPATTPESERIFDILVADSTALMSLNISKRAVLDADAMALALLSRAGYDAEALLDLIAALHVRDTEDIMAFLYSTHPKPAYRLELLYKLTVEKGSELPRGERPPLQRRITR